MPGLGSLIGKESSASGILKSLDVGGGSDADNFISILKSRRLAEKVIDRFDLVHAYRFDKRKKYFIEDVLKALDKNGKKISAGTRAPRRHARCTDRSCESGLLYKRAEST